MQESKIDGFNTYFKYLSNLIIIEHQQQMYRLTLNITLIKKNLVASSTLKSDYTTPYLGTVFPPPSLKTSEKS